MLSLDRDIVLLIRQFLEQNQFKESVHKLEQESGFFFKLDYFKEKGMAGDWDEVAKYLSGFIKIKDKNSGFSRKMYYLISRQKYLEALDRHDKEVAVDVLKNDLGVFFDDDEEKYKQLTMLLTIDNFRECEKFSKFGDTINSTRETTMRKLKKQIERNPFFGVHLECPRLDASRLETLIHQSLNWQQQKCQNPRSNTVIQALFTGHACSPPNYTPIMESSEIVVFVKRYTVTARHNNIIKVVRLLYTNSGNGLLALGSTGTLKLWKRIPIQQKLRAKAGGRPPYSLICNDVNNLNPQRAVIPCIAISKDDSLLVSARGGTISWHKFFMMPTQSLKATFMPPTPGAATFLVFHPYDNNIIAIGMDDSSIHIYDIVMSMLCFWSICPWALKNSLLIRMPAGKQPVGPTEVQFHSDQVRLLVWHESHLAIYNASSMDLIQQWVPPERMVSGSITSATYSCNSQLVYASFTDENIAVLNSHSFRLRCRVTSCAYLPRDSDTIFLKENSGKRVYPCVVAAHPWEPNQLALGLSDGSVHIIKPLESGGTWGSYEQSHSEEFTC